MHLDSIDLSLGHLEAFQEKDISISILKFKTFFFYFECLCADTTPIGYRVHPTLHPSYELIRFERSLQITLQAYFISIRRRLDE